jgi:1-aminocyclopropane-1-carboxylate deaminase/D-cysteine desulfhydrase-like pyridoxal-dependent ACC family enzyme
MTGGPELGGNKVRKLEFLLADALGRGCDSIVTIGGEQSNHCRATACAARLVGLYPHLILRTSPTSSSSSSSKPSTPQVESSSQTSTTKDLHNNFHDDVDVSLGLQGNILFDRIVGSTIYTCTAGEVCAEKKQNLYCFRASVFQFFIPPSPLVPMLILFIFSMAV